MWKHTCSPNTQKATGRYRYSLKVQCEKSTMQGKAEYRNAVARFIHVMIRGLYLQLASNRSRQFPKSLLSSVRCQLTNPKNHLVPTMKTNLISDISIKLYSAIFRLTQLEKWISYVIVLYNFLSKSHSHNIIKDN